jgi:hypothetical protein
MSRGLPGDVATAVASQNVNLVLFAKLEFPSPTGTLYLHNGLGTYTWDSQDWLGVGDLGTISQVQEGMDISPYAITLQLSGLDTDMAGIALNDTVDYYMRPVTVYLGVLDSSDDLLADPTQIFAGFMDQMNLSVGASGGDAIQLVAESELARFDKSANYMYTNASQQEEHSGDLFFNHLHKIEGAKIKWRGTEGGGGAGSPGTPQDPGDIKEYREFFPV